MPWFRWVAPGRSQIRLYQIDGVMPVGYNETPHRRPRGDKCQKIVQRPVMRNREVRVLHLLEGEGQRGVSIVHNGKFAGPVGANDIVVKVIDYGVDLRRDTGKLVGPDGTHTTRP